MKVPEPQQEEPLAWMAVLADTPVHSSDGQDVGVVGEVLGSQSEDIFHGLVVRGGFLTADVVIPAEHVTAITNKRIDTDLTAQEIRDLPVYNEEESFKLGFVGFLGRRLGWVKDRDPDPK